ncbi:LacI family transcriptional regulator [Flavobacterium jejuense]|uniref:LacI family transcriptional regulator n=1 Tax=Flavobacterium jejuense TaxID=1544455 RepID=A0ABX0IQF6_9FLAO|nr:LacI family DNA-binding transcriptional regulator [Flavobacterium jejuense]NHN25806.1 LacI family transcriptional regulator [Flavobacterium jejuense]
MVTLKKISNLTGFSISTISKALNDRNDINNDTKKIIQDYAIKINYKPNKNALALRGYKSFIIAIIVPQINDTLYSELLCDLQLCATKFGYRILLFQSFDAMSKITEYLREVNDGSVDASFVLSTNEKPINKKLTDAKNIPVEYIQIFKNQQKIELKANCISIFENLLKQIK